MVNESDATYAFVDKDSIVRNPDGESIGILRNSRNNQYQYGAISKVKIQWSEKLKTTIGIDWRTAEIEHYREVRDLLGGKYYIDNSDDFNPNNKAKLGDKIAYNFTNNVDWIGGFAQSEYHTDLITAYATLGYSMIKYQHTNHFVKDEATGSELKVDADYISGYQLKGGLSYKVSNTLTAYGNAGYVSKVPVFDAVINDRTHEKIENPENEKFMSGEIGLNFRSADRKLTANINLYHTYWQNRVLTDPYYDDAEGDEGLFVINKLDAIHQGIEFDMAVQPNKFFRIDGAISVGNWYNNDDATATLKYYDGAQPDTVFNVYVKDLKTGDAPQTQFAFAGTVFPAKGLWFTVSLRHYADFYADWSALSRTDKDDKAQSWKTPAYSVFDLHAGYTLPLEGNYGIEIFAHVFNLFNTLYIQDATDNSPYNAYYGTDNVNSHAASAAEVFLGIPRTFNAGIMISIR